MIYLWNAADWIGVRYDHFPQGELGDVWPMPRNPS
jgi:hypothetical protein